MAVRPPIVACLVVACLVVALLATMPFRASAQSARQGDSRALLSGATTWGYQLQDIKPGPLLKSAYDVLVIDPGTPAPLAQLSKGDLQHLKKKPDGSRRLVLAYMNIGEAEDYRYYWRKEWDKTPPAWMGTENCRWRGDHRVRFWMREWQDIVFGSKQSMLGRIIAAGFDGVFLDRVDIQRFWKSERPSSYDDMVAFVAGMSAWAKKERPGFLVVPQNGEDLLASETYRAAIDAQAKEDLLFGDNGNDVANDLARRDKATGYIVEAKRAGLPVFVIEYLKDSANIAQAKDELGRLGFVAYFGPRSLSRLGIGGPAHPEDGTTEPVLPEGATGGTGACD